MVIIRMVTSKLSWNIKADDRSVQNSITWNQLPHNFPNLGQSREPGKILITLLMKCSSPNRSSRMPKKSHVTSVFSLPSKFLINPDHPYEQRDTRRLNILGLKKVLNHITFHLSFKPYCSKGPLGSVRMKTSWSH